MFDALICINKNVSLHKMFSRNKFMSLLKITNLRFCSNLQCTKCCFASADVTAPSIKCDEGQWSNDVTVMPIVMSQWVGDVV